MVLTPFDDYPIHQTPMALAHAGNGHPDHYDRFWFNGYTEDFYFAVALGIYPNRGVIDAAFSVVHERTQRSVFASGRAPLDRTQTAIGPIRIEIVEPLRVNRVVVDAPEHGLSADITFTARTAGYEEPRQTRYLGSRLIIDMTRASQLGRWAGSVTVDGATRVLDEQTVYGTKDRSWGLRPIGLPAPAAPSLGGAAVLSVGAFEFRRCRGALSDVRGSGGAVLGAQRGRAADPAARRSGLRPTRPGGAHRHHPHDRLGAGPAPLAGRAPDLPAR